MNKFEIWVSREEKRTIAAAYMDVRRGVLLLFNENNKLVYAVQKGKWEFVRQVYS